MKRLLTIAAVVIILLGVGVAIYFVFFSPTAPRLTVSNSTFPGSGSASTTPSGTGNVGSGAGTVVAPGLVEITNQPVAAGVAVFDTLLPANGALGTSGTSTASSSPAAMNMDIAVNYIDRASGNVYQYTVNARSLTRIGNKTLPGIQQASWVPNGSEAFVQFLSNTGGSEQLDTYALPATGDGGYFLQSGLAQATMFGSSTLFTLLTDADSSIGTTAYPDGTGPRTLFSSPLTSIHVQAAGTGYIAVPAAANSLDGYVFAIGPSGFFTPILGPLRGLTALASPDGNSILYSYTDGTEFYMNVFDRVTGGITNLPLATLAEKCVWTADSTAVYCAVPTSFPGTLPDDWYQGAVSFSDRIWRIDLSTHLASLVLDPSATASTTIDAVNLTLDPNAHVLVFRNKKDSSLWAENL